MALNPEILITNLSDLPLGVVSLLAFGTAFLITWKAIPSIVGVAQCKGLFDVPNGRTSHFGRVPNLGGVGVFGGLLLSSVLFTGLSSVFELKYIIAGMVVLFFVGVKDDIMVIDPKNKLVGQLVAVFLTVVLGDIHITSFHGLFGIHEIPYLFSVLFTTFVFLIIINGFNLIDGIDGLSSGIAILVSLVFGIWFFIFGMNAYAIMSLAFIGSLLAFFRYNVYGKKNKVFMGDTGSMIVGFMVAVFAVNYMEYGVKNPASFGAHVSPAIAFSILILPLFDTLRVFVIRISRRGSPFKPDRRHIHHILLDLGLTHIQATSILIAVNIFFVLLAFSLQSMGNLFLIALSMSLATALSWVLWVFQTRKKNSFEYKYKKLREQMFISISNLNNPDGDKIFTKVS